MREDFLHYLWKYRKIPPNVTLTSGESLIIQSFGEYNQLSGPDFLSAQIQIDNQKWAGNVEMHLKSSYWYAHRHEQDVAYNNVILHVVWEHDVEVFDSNQQIIPTLELKEQIDKDLVVNYQNLLFSENRFIPCQKHFLLAERMVSTYWNRHLFVERLTNKANFIQTLLLKTCSDWEKVLFLMLLKNFGGVVNGEAFLKMGETIDFSVVRKEKNNPLHLEALFLGQGNLLTGGYEEPYYKKLLDIYSFLKNKYNLNPSFEKIHFSKLRPQGFPTVRLSQLAQLYEKTDGLFSKIIESDGVSGNLRSTLSVSTSEFWETHYTFGKVSAKSKKKVATSLLNLILINTIIPLKYLYFSSLKKDVLEMLIETIRSVPPEENSIIDSFRSLGKEIGSAFDSQVSLQQYKNYCLSKRCLDCALGVFLLKNNIDFS